MKTEISIETLISAPIERIWEYWTDPAHIQEWCHASDDWCAPHATNDLKVGGKFLTRMEAKNGSAGFDFEGTYTAIEPYKKIEYVIFGDDERKVEISFLPEGGGYKIIERFEIEKINPPEMQKNGWQAILNNFKKYVEEMERTREEQEKY